MIQLSRSTAEELLFREALYLDRREWASWIALYTEDSIFWMPAWRDETHPTADPERETSLIYYRGRRNLEDRVWRVESGLSVASTPLPRSVHGVTNVLVEACTDGEAQVAATFTVHLYDVRSGRTHVFFGRYEYQLRSIGTSWLVARKKIYLLNDVIPTVIDFYAI